MLKIQQKSGFAFVKVAQNSLSSGISASAIGCLSVLELIRTNPKHSFNMDYISRTLQPYAHFKKSLKELEQNGYLTKHCFPVGYSNAFNWRVEADSFCQNIGNYGVVYYDMEGNTSKGCNFRCVKKVEVSEKFIMVPKELLLDRKVSLSGKGLFALMMLLPEKDYSKDEIRKVLSMKSYEFNKSWKELVNAGYLVFQKTSDRKYDFILCPTPLPVENEGYAKCRHNKQIFKINTNTYESNIHDESVPVPVLNLTELADALILSKPLDCRSVANVLFNNHSNVRIRRFNEELIRFFGNSITEYLDYKTILEKYRNACRILSVKDDIKSLGGYIHTILNKSFAPEKKRVCFDYSKKTKEGLLSEWLLSEWEENKNNKSKWEKTYQTYQKSQYDFKVLNAFVFAN